MGGSLIQHKNSRERKGSIRALKKEVGRVLEHSVDFHTLLNLAYGSTISLINALFKIRRSLCRGYAAWIMRSLKAERALTEIKQELIHDHTFNPHLKELKL